MSMSEPDAQPRIDMLRTLTHAEFRAGLQAAQQRRDETAALYDAYKKWFARLEPYLACDPRLTVDEALVLYRADCELTQRSACSAGE